MALSFEVLRKANAARLPTFKNKFGMRAHSTDDGSDWKLSAWVNATAGENGELADALLMIMLTRAIGMMANEAKKIERGEYAASSDEQREEIGSYLHNRFADEAADVVTYLDILCARMGVNLGDAVIHKFNDVSMRVKSSVVILVDGNEYIDAEGAHQNA
jgi:NTP pyrophosphatase (non-canonical NTP hydrolase)